MKIKGEVRTQIASACSDRQMTVSEKIAEMSSDHRNYWLRYAIRETLELLPSDAVEVLLDFMAGRSVCEMARLAGMRPDAFVGSRWNPAVKLFKRAWGQR